MHVVGSFVLRKRTCMELLVWLMCKQLMKYIYMALLSLKTWCIYTLEMALSLVYFEISAQK